MEQEQARENNIPEQTQSTNEEHVVLIHDKKENKLNAVSQIDKDGNFKSVPFDEKNQNSFLKINPSSGILESFFKNFWSQAIEPTRFRLLSFTEKMLKTKPTKQILTNIMKGNLTKEVDEFIEKFLLTAKNFSKNRQNSETSKAYRFKEDQIDWKELGKYGITKEYLAENGLLEQLLMGKKTDERVPITMKFKSCQLITALPVSLNYNRDEKVELKIHGISKNLRLTFLFLDIPLQKRTGKIYS